MAEPNHPLREWLDRLGWRPETLAFRLNAFARQQRRPVTIHIKTPYAWLTRGCQPRRPVPELVAALISQAAGVTVTQADLGWPADAAPAGELPADTGLPPQWAQDATVEALDDVARCCGMRRRTFLTISGVAVTAPAERWMLDTAQLGAALDGHRFGNELITEIERSIDTKRRQDDLLGGGAVHDSVREELRLLVRLIKTGSYDSHTERRLYGCAAELARLAGWTCYDIGHHGLAQRYFLLALRCAHTAQDPPLGANVLGVMGNQTLFRGYHGEAVTLLESAWRGARSSLSAVEKAALRARTALALARTGEASTAAAAIEEATAWMGRTDPPNDPEYMYWFDQAELQWWTGQTHLASGNAEQAIAHLQHAMQLVPPTRPRSRATYQVSLAQAHLANGQLAQATCLAADAPNHLGPTDSHRLHRFIRAFDRQLDSYAAAPEVVAFRNQLRAEPGGDGERSVRHLPAGLTG